MQEEIESLADIVTEGWPYGTTKGKVLACLLAQTRLKKEDLGRIDLKQGYARIEWLGKEKEGLLAEMRGTTHLIVDERKVLCWSTLSGQSHQEWSSAMQEALERLASWERREIAEDDRSFKLRRVDEDTDHLDRIIWVFEGVKGFSLEEAGYSRWQGVQLKNSSHTLEGRVVACENGQLHIQLSMEIEDGSGDLWEISPAFHELGHRRRLRAVERMPSVLEFHEKYFVPSSDVGNESSLELNQRQLEALRTVQKEKCLLIHGPPGTGKTHLLGKIISMFASKGDRVLACAASHSACDHLARVTSKAGVSPLRLGQIERVSEDILPFHLLKVMEEDDEIKTGKMMIKDGYSLLRSSRGTSQDRKEASALIKDGKELVRRRRQDMISRAPLLISTLTHLDPAIYGSLDVDLVVVDEAGQCLEPEAWMGLSMGKRWVLVGDPQQLPATVKGNDDTLRVSLLERWMEEGICCVSLEEQYRMTPTLMGFPSQHFYGGKLIAAGKKEVQEQDCFLRFVDMAGAGDGEEVSGRSLLNSHEADFLVCELDRLIDSGIDPESIGVICPYRAQVEALSQKVFKRGVEIKSIDGFQGREKEVIVMSLVRSNSRGELGFLEDYRRMNVALTRAKKALLVIGDSSTLSGDPFYSSWLDYVETNGEYRSYFEYEDV